MTVKESRKSATDDRDQRSRRLRLAAAALGAGGGGRPAGLQRAVHPGAAPGQRRSSPSWSPTVRATARPSGSPRASPTRAPPGDVLHLQRQPRHRRDRRAPNADGSYTAPALDGTSGDRVFVYYVTQAGCDSETVCRQLVEGDPAPDLPAVARRRSARRYSRAGRLGRAPSELARTALDRGRRRRPAAAAAAPSRRRAGVGLRRARSSRPPG